MVKAQISIL